MSQGLSFAWDESAVCEAPQPRESVSLPPSDLRKTWEISPALRKYNMPHCEIKKKKKKKKQLHTFISLSIRTISNVR